MMHLYNLGTAKNGHFGHPEFGWEKTDQAAKLAS